MTRKQAMIHEWLILSLLLTLGSAQNQNPDSTHCLLLSNHPGTCLHFLTKQPYTFDQARHACWSQYRAVPFVPLNDVDHHDLLVKFYFHAKNNKAYDGNIGLGILVDEQNNYYREHLNKYVGKHTTPDLHMWNQLIYNHKISETHDSEQRYTVDYPIIKVAKKAPTGYLRVNGKTGRIQQVSFQDKSYFACHSPRYPKFNCHPGWYTDYLSRSCMHHHVLGEKISRAEGIVYCKKWNANLASIHDQREYNIFYSFIKKPDMTPAEEAEQTAGTEYWFGLRHQNNLKPYEEGGLGNSATPGFNERYKKVAYFMDGTAYTGFHRFHKIEPTSESNQGNYNGQTLTNNGWYRNWKNVATMSIIKGVLCQSVVDISGTYI